MLFAELRNKYYGTNEGRGQQDNKQDTQQDDKQDDPRKALIGFCSVPRSRQEMMDFLGLKDRPNFTQHYLKPMLEAGLLNMTVPDKPSSKNQKYVSAK